ncbi:MAG: hypothetical protein GWP59_03835, partial [Chlamydiales bacterium]|nr:hypothetical protein [Chlamydiales bacterium]
RIKRAAKRGDVQAQLKLKANRMLIRHKMKTLKKTINRMGFSAGPIDPEVYRNMDGATHQDLFRGGWLT